MSEELRSLIKKRGSIKGRLTLFKNHLAEIEADLVSKNENVVDRDAYIELESRLERLGNIFNDFNDVQTAIEAIHDNYDEQLNERGNFEALYYKLVSRAKRILFNTMEQKQEMSSNIGGQLPNSSNSARVTLQAIPRLQNIPVPKFKGGYEDWVEFRDTFESLIHNNQSLTDIEKFHFLKGSLEGEAKDVIQSLEISNTNYKTAWDLLRERYNNSTYLVNNQVKLLFSLPPLKHESASDLRKLYDSFVKHVRSLNNLGQSTDTWDVMLIYLISEKLDPTTHREWEKNKSRTTLPTLEEFKTFIKTQVEFLESVEAKRVEVKQSNKAQKLQPKSQQTFVATNPKCALCKDGHHINNCGQFLKLTTYARFEQVKRLKLCLNCLKANHISKDCKSGACKKCQAKHHTLLHYDKQPGQGSTSGSSLESGGKDNQIETQSNPKSSDDSQAIVLASSNFKNESEVLLSTALVQVVDAVGNSHTCRALLDSGSQSNLITNSLCNKLKLPKTNVNLSIMGISQVVSEIKHKCCVKLQSCHNAFEKKLSCLVVEKIGENIPGRYINVAHLQIPKHLKLADPNFQVPGTVELLIGAPLFYELLCIGQVRLGEKQPFLQKTRFGWIISGSVNFNQPSKVSCVFNSYAGIQEQLAKFWEIEEPSLMSPTLSQDERQCEEIFVKTTIRKDDGRFQVNIPLKDSPLRLGDSEECALKRFQSLEARLSRNPKLKQMYTEFLVEYEQMGHMSKLQKESSNQVSYFFPHHGVLNEKSSTTKLRVVFNGSAQSDSGVSLNDIQYVGPIIQNDLLSIMLRFRQHNVVVCADIAKMYRMIEINPEHRSLQKIFWRANADEELKVYTLNTVTYGTASAPFLAIRCLRQLGFESQEKTPEASRVILQDFYVDDLLTGADSVEKAVQICQDVNSILQSGCFHLRKWVSNRHEVLQQIDKESAGCHKIVEFGEKGETKTLGLYWSSNRDVLMYNIQISDITRSVTKRAVLSDISRIFDPLGLLSPCIIIAKILLQKLWTQKLSWDESLPSDIDKSWRMFKEKMSYLNQVEIPRQVVCVRYSRVELHGFSDASTEAYGGCVYVRSIDSNGKIQVSLVCAKSRVAPIKSITVPRLELCGALVLVQVVQKVRQSMNLKFENTYLWSDSTVALSWIATPPNLLQTFVSNRVSQIQSLSKPEQWRHVKSEHNPADSLSRGISPENLAQCNMWWNGPVWLMDHENQWPNSSVQRQLDVPEMKKVSAVLQSSNAILFIDYSRFSNLSRMNRAIAYVLRFVNILRSKSGHQRGHLKVGELYASMTLLTKLSQQECFPNEIKELQQKTGLSSKGPLLGLNPFLDANGLMRVGGRLQLSKFEFEKKHPLILHAKHKLTILIFEYEHLRLLHAGPQLLLSSIRERYWPIKGRNLAKHTVHKCVRCFRAKPVGKPPLMGILPELRVQPMPPFYCTGVDYAGPVSIKSQYGRKVKFFKGYICLFVCFSTKAVHLELVSDLTKEAFIASFRRFVSRRGKPLYVYSDNGLNFVGANAELKELGNFLQTQQNTLTDAFVNEGITWRFIPAHSPHFGGLWEAGIRSSKYHLKRVMANASLSFEDFYTLLTQIEAVLNSRPITPLSSDPSDLDVLTPAHFLIGKRLTSLPDPDVREIKQNRLSRYQHLQMLYQHFWARWSKEYVAELQHRTKWKTHHDSLKIGQVVLLKEDNLPPLKWKIGRIINIHPGPDGKVRVASVKTPNGVVKRAFSKICPLPIESDLINK